MKYQNQTEHLEAARRILERWNTKHPEKQIPWEWVEERITSEHLWRDGNKEYHSLYMEFTNHLPEGLKFELFKDTLDFVTKNPEVFDGEWVYRFSEELQATPDEVRQWLETSTAMGFGVNTPLGDIEITVLFNRYLGKVQLFGKISKDQSVSNEPSKLI